VLVGKSIFFFANFSFPGAAEKTQLQESHKDLAEKHKAELQQEKGEVARLKKELEDLKVAHARELQEVSGSIAEEKDRLEGQVLKYKDLAEDAEKRTQAWISQLAKINSEMSSKFFSFLNFSLCTQTGICF